MSHNIDIGEIVKNISCNTVLNTPSHSVTVGAPAPNPKECVITATLAFSRLCNKAPMTSTAHQFSVSAISCTRTKAKNISKWKRQGARARAFEKTPSTVSVNDL